MLIRQGDSLFSVCHITVLVVAAFDVLAASAVAAVLLLLFVCPLFPHSIVTVTALESGRIPHGGGSGRSPHGGGQRYVAVLLLRIRLLPLPASHPLAKLVIFFCHRLTVF